MKSLITDTSQYPVLCLEYFVISIMFQSSTERHRSAVDVQRVSLLPLSFGNGFLLVPLLAKVLVSEIMTCDYPHHLERESERVQKKMNDI